MNNFLIITLLVGVIVMLGLAILLLLIQFRKVSTRLRRNRLLPVLLPLGTLRRVRLRLIDPFAMVSRNRQEQSTQSQALRSEVVTALTGLGESVPIKVEGLTRSNDQKLELLRFEVKNSLDAFTSESEHKIDNLTQSVAGSAGKLKNTVSAKLAEFTHALGTDRFVG